MLRRVSRELRGLLVRDENAILMTVQRAWSVATGHVPQHKFSASDFDAENIVEAPAAPATMLQLADFRNIVDYSHEGSKDMPKVTQASRSHPEDARGEHTKASQRPVPANSQPGTTSTNVHESRDVIQKTKPTPAHVGPHNRPGEERDSLNEAQLKRIDRSHPGYAKEVAGAAARARKEHHGKSTNTDGTSFAVPGKQVAMLE